MTAPFDLRPAADFSAADLHAAFARGFSDYLTGPFTLPLSGWPVLLGRHGVDLAESRVAATPAGAILALAFVAPRQDVDAWRLATMAAGPEARGSGAAPALLDDFLARARGAGKAFVELECFVQNERAQRLYRSRGFAPVHELFGYTAAAGALPAEVSAEVAEVPLQDAYDWVDAVSRRRGDLPLQVTSVSLRAQPLAQQAWRCGRAQLVLGKPSPGQLSLLSLVDDGSPGQADAKRLLMHAAALHPGLGLHAIQLQRRDLGGEALEALGAQRLPLHQVLMRRPTIIRG